MVAGIIGSVILAILGFLAQIAFFPAMGAVAVGPNAILAVAIVFGMIYGPWPAMAMGFFGGLAVDFMAGGAVGISALIPLIIGFLVGVFNKEINSTHFAWAIIFAAIAHIINDIWMAFTLYFARITLFVEWGTLFRSILSAVETGLMAGLTFAIITKLLSFAEKRTASPYLKRY